MQIGEIAKVFNISVDTLRYYEKAGLIKVVKKQHGIRIYSDSDVQRVAFIVCMRNAGMNIRALKAYLDSVDIGEDSSKRKQMLIDQKKKLEIKMQDLKTAIDYLTNKIKNYDTNIVEAEKNFREKK